MNQLIKNKNIPIRQFLIFVFVGAFILSCSQKKQTSQGAITPAVVSKVNHPEWTKNATIYEVNIRQYTPEGTFNAFARHLPRLKNLGVEILWIMPIHPIGSEKRKGKLGSYYSVRDYKAVNPEFGTMQDFDTLVRQAHNLGLKVIIDWVANHTAWDNQWAKDHPDWYKKDSLGNFYGPFDWTDVIELNYDNQEMKAAMIDAMKFWVEKAGIDGFRCDVAGLVPKTFWDTARLALEEIKPVFMLAEDEENPLLLEKAFDMNYSWSFHSIMNRIANGEANVDDIREYFRREDSIYPKSCYRMQFITNHDENSWNGTEFERLGNGVNTFATLIFTVPGMPLVYTGQEVGMNKRLEFFTKDKVTYTKNNFPEFYKGLIELKKTNQVLWNGDLGGDMAILDSADKQVFVFKRYNKTSEILVVLNLSGVQHEIVVPDGIVGAFSDYFLGETVVLDEGEKLSLLPWEYKIYIQK
jgi:glycosidase